MNGGRAVDPGTGFGMVFLMAVLGLALASLVVLTPWHMSDLPGGAPQHSVVEKNPAVGGKVVVPGR